MRFDRILLAVIVVIFVTHACAAVFSWHVTHPWIDIPLHIAGGLWVGLLFFYVFFERRQLLPRNLGFFPTSFLCLGFVAFIGTGWECYEYLSQVLLTKETAFGGSVPGVHFDTLKDLFDDTVGGAMTTLWYFRSRLKTGVRRGDNV